MAIKQLPESYEAFERFNVDYERERFASTESSRRVGRATREMFLAWFPWVPKRFGAPGLYAVMDDRLLDAFGFPRPPPLLRRAVETALRARARAIRLAAARDSGRRCATARIREVGDSRSWDRLKRRSPRCRRRAGASSGRPRPARAS